MPTEQEGSSPSSGGGSRASTLRHLVAEQPSQLPQEVYGVARSDSRVSRTSRASRKSPPLAAPAVPTLPPGAPVPTLPPGAPANMPNASLLAAMPGHASAPGAALPANAPVAAALIATAHGAAPQATAAISGFPPSAPGAALTPIAPRPPEPVQAHGSMIPTPSSSHENPSFRGLPLGLPPTAAALGALPLTLQLPAMPSSLMHRPLQVPEVIRSENDGLDRPTSSLRREPSLGVVPSVTSSVEADRHMSTPEPRAPAWSCGCLSRRRLHLRPAAHGAVVASLLACHLTEMDSEGSNLFTALFGSLILALLLLTQLRSLQCCRACSPPRLAVACLHAGMCFCAARQRLRSTRRALPPDQEDGRLAVWLGLMQILSVLLYPTRLASVALTSVVFLATLMMHLATRPSSLTLDTQPCWQWAAVLLALAWASGLAAAPSEGNHSLLGELLLVQSEPGGTARTVCPTSEELSKFDPDPNEHQRRVLKDLFRPIFSLKDASGGDDDTPMVGTYLSHIVARIINTAQRVSQTSTLQEPLRVALADALTIIAKELGQTSTLQRIPEATLANRSSAIVSYVQTMLHPALAEANVRDSQRPTPTNSESLVSVASPRSTFQHNSIISVCSSTCQAEDLRGQQYGETVATMTNVLNPARDQSRTPTIRMSRAQGNQLLAASGFELGSWHANLFGIFEEGPSKQPILVIGRPAVQAHSDRLGIEASKIVTFFEAIEERYIADNPYHNSLHGADVMNSLLYFLRLPTEPMLSLNDLEKLTCILVASAHDVGHTGKANRYHTVTQTPLAQLFNDQSVLENMHCAIMFAVMRVEASNILGSLDAPSQAAFRNQAVQMILGTDLAKHVKAVSQFRQEYVDTGRPGAPDGSATELTPVQRREVASFLLKCSDVGGSAKPFNIHVQWSMRICSEFYAQGDAESALGIPCSPFCDRKGTSLRECQKGFFDFVVAPMFLVLGEYLRSPRIQIEVQEQMDQNRRFWKKFDDENVDHNDTMANVPRLQAAFVRCSQQTNLSFGTLSVCSKAG